VRKNIKKGNLKIELYDLEKDICEENDISEQFHDVVEKISTIMKKEHRRAENPAFRIEQLDGAEF